MASSTYPIYMATVSAPTNIAVIKYWGKASVEFNTPINDSLSVTLNQSDGLMAVTTVAASKSFTNDRLWLNGTEEMTTESKRFRACVDGVKALASTVNDVTPQDWKDMHVHVSSYNTFPTAAGLASSAAGYAALVAALAELMHAVEAFPGQLSTLARQGSGSACRSLYGGFVAWRKGTSSSVGCIDSKAECVAPETHWPALRALVLVVSDQEKDTSSTAGMNTSVATSLLLKHRAEAIVPTRMRAMEEAVLAKDFSTFCKLTMQDSNQFHATCLDTYPPIFYLNDISASVIRMITAYNHWSGEIRAAYTFDAGPNAVLYVQEQHVTELTALVLQYYPPPTAENDNPNYYFHPDESNDVWTQAQAFVLDPDLVAAIDKTGRVPKSGDVKMVYATKPGPGPQVLSSDDANLDPNTGLNTYVCTDNNSLKKRKL
jgi:diphosphomevalonate decarboxylase